MGVLDQRECKCACYYPGRLVLRWLGRGFGGWVEVRVVL